MRWIMATMVMGLVALGCGNSEPTFDCSQAEGESFSGSLGARTDFDIDGDGIVTSGDFAQYLGICEG